MIVVAKSETDPRWLCRHHAAPLRCEPIAKMSAADREELERLLAQADKVSAKVRRAFLESVDRLQSSVDIDDIKDLLRQGRVDQATSLINQRVLGSGWAPVANAAASGLIDSATVIARTATETLRGLHVDFGLTNPSTVAHLRNYEMGLIRGLSSDALASVREAIRAGVTAGRNPLDVARDVRQFITLTPRQTQAVLNYRRELEGLDRAALARALRDGRSDSSILRAIRDGKTIDPAKIDKLVQRYSARWLKYRSETIARTEGIRSVNAGNHLLWNQAVADGKLDEHQITRDWLTVGDHKVRPSHRAIPEMNASGVGLNVPFQSPEGPIMYPGDPSAPASLTVNCRCTCLYRFKLKSSTPPSPAARQLPRAA